MVNVLRTRAENNQSGGRLGRGPGLHRVPCGDKRGSLQRTPVRVWAYVLSVAGTTIVALILATQDAQISWPAAMAFGLLFASSELATVRIGQLFYSTSFVISIAALVALGPVEAAVAGLFGGLDRTMNRRPDWVPRALFNAAQFSLSTLLAGITYQAVGAPIGRVDGASLPIMMLGVSAAALVHFLANTLLVTGVVSLSQKTPPREIWHQHYAGIPPRTFAFAVVGLLFASLYLEMGMMAVLFVVVPLLIARRALQAAAQMDDAYEATLRGLVTAIEAKDAYTRGHAERVSRLSAMIARELGLSERRVRALRIAALMHDVGKLVVATPILTKPGKLTDEEYEHMKSHPIHGCEVISEIDFLHDGEAVHAVRHHHERLDGRGYPDGLAGDEVPLTARIVMCADAFDSMTSTRTYRRALDVEQAMRELRRCSATQFDPLSIQALARAIERHGWEPTPELYQGEQVPRPEASVHVGL